jgi:hypothetical protein
MVRRAARRRASEEEVRSVAIVGPLVVAAVLTACAPPGMAPAVRTARVYPAMGQFPDQQDRDSHACTVWAQQQNAKASGFSGVVETVGGAVTGAGTPGYGWNMAGADHAYAVCMNSRGYAVYWNQ